MAALDAAAVVWAVTGIVVELDTTVVVVDTGLAVVVGLDAAVYNNGGSGYRCSGSLRHRS